MSDDGAARAHWDAVLSELDGGELTGQERATLSVCRPLGVVEDTFVLITPTELSRDLVEQRLQTVLNDGLTRQLGRPVTLAVSVDKSSAGVEQSAVADARDEGRPTAPPAAAARPPAEPARLNDKYVFESFVIGASNRFAHAAAIAVAESPASAFNPLFIYGESGLGKTHLLHAIGHYAQKFSQARVCYVSSEEFTNDFINSIRDDRAATFQRRYRDTDVLLVDDIQFLMGKERTQEEFFHTFNALHNGGKQIVITSDRPAAMLNTLEDRLRNRFQWGLMTDITPPDVETRIAILRRKAEQERLVVPDDVLELIAVKVSTNIRELEGALIRVTAFASLSHQEVDLAMAKIVLRDLGSGGPEITVAMIMAVTCEFFDLTMDELIGKARSRRFVAGRQIAMYLVRELTDLSLPKIGDAFGGRDHTTVMHGVAKVKTSLSERQDVYNSVTTLTERIRARARNGQG